MTKRNIGTRTVEIYPQEYDLGGEQHIRIRVAGYPIELVVASHFQDGVPWFKLGVTRPGGHDLLGAHDLAYVALTRWGDIVITPSSRVLFRGNPTVEQDITNAKKPAPAADKGE